MTCTASRLAPTKPRGLSAGAGASVAGAGGASADAGASAGAPAAQAADQKRFVGSISL